MFFVFVLSFLLDKLDILLHSILNNAVVARTRILSHLHSFSLFSLRRQTDDYDIFPSRLPPCPPRSASESRGRGGSGSANCGDGLQRFGGFCVSVAPQRVDEIIPRCFDEPGTLLLHGANVGRIYSSDTCRQEPSMSLTSCRLVSIG